MGFDYPKVPARRGESGNDNCRRPAKVIDVIQRSLTRTREAKEYTALLEGEGIQISMDGKGRAFDNILVERLWRSVKYEEVYLKRPETGEEAVEGLDRYLAFYNDERLHQSLGYCTPRSCYYEEKELVC